MEARRQTNRNIRPQAPASAKMRGYVAFDGTVSTAKRATLFTKAGVAKLKPPAEGQVDFFQKLERGITLVLRLSYGGTKAWRVIYYVNGRGRVKTIGRYPKMDVAAARKLAYRFDSKGENAAADAGTFKAVAEDWIKRHVVENKLRSRHQIERQLQTYIFPAWARLPFFEVRRKAVSELLDKIADKHGRPQADAVLATIRSICNWYATRDEHYSTPIVKKMRRDKRKATERARKRTLSDDEIRAVWKAAEDAGNFGSIVRLALLTGQRRQKIATMRWDDVNDGVWTIRTEPGEKGNGERLKLLGAALDIIKEQPKVDGNPYVFAGSLSGRRRKSATEAKEPPCFNAWSQRKAELDAKLPKDMPHWTVHDLRRTARTLMSRAGIDKHIGERVLGHAILGVEGVYDRHDYYEEKAAALAKLDVLLDQIVNPPDRTNVVPMEARREQAQVTGQ